MDAEFWELAEETHEEMSIQPMDKQEVMARCKPLLEQIKERRAHKPDATMSVLDHLLTIGEADVIEAIREAACARYPQESNVTDADSEEARVAGDATTCNEEYWQGFKSVMNGGAVDWPQRLSDAELKAMGLKSWKQYYILKSLDYY